MIVPLSYGSTPTILAGPDLPLEEPSTFQNQILLGILICCHIRTAKWAILIPSFHQLNHMSIVQQTTNVTLGLETLLQVQVHLHTSTASKLN